MRATDYGFRYRAADDFAVEQRNKFRAPRGVNGRDEFRAPMRLERGIYSAASHTRTLEIF
jgi:hypothetical protein